MDGIQGPWSPPTAASGNKCEGETRRQKPGSVHDSTWTGTAGFRLERAPLWCCGAYLWVGSWEGTGDISSAMSQLNFLAGKWPYQTGAQLTSSCPISTGCTLCFPFELIHICQACFVLNSQRGRGLSTFSQPSESQTKDFLSSSPLLWKSFITLLKLAFQANVFCALRTYNQGQDETVGSSNYTVK